MYGLKQDTFQKSSNINFTGSISDSAQDILDDSNKLNGFAAFMAAGFAALQSLANKSKRIDGEKSEETEKKSAPEFMAEVYVRNTSIKDELSEKTAEIEQLKSENNELKEKLKNIQPDIITDNVNLQTESAEELLTSEEINTDIPFVFPKKRGRLSKNQQALKDITEGLNLSESESQQLTLVCQELLTKNSHKIGPELVDNDVITCDLVKDLSANLADNSKIAEIIDGYAVKCEIKPMDEQQNVPTDLERDSLSEQIETATVQDNFEINMQRSPKRQRIYISRPDKGAYNSDDLYYIKLPGTPNDTKYLLSKIIKKYEYSKLNERKNNEYIKWMTRYPVSERVLDYDVSNELSNHDYPRINEYSSAEEISDAINSDERFHQMFTLHSSMRLIERYVNFRDENNSVEEQCHNILDSLCNLIQISCQNGMDIQEYSEVSKLKHKFYGAAITIPTKYYDDDARKIFGSYPITMGICECQDHNAGYDKNRKEGLICTIYPQGY